MDAFLANDTKIREQGEKVRKVISFDFNESINQFFIWKSLYKNPFIFSVLWEKTAFEENAEEKALKSIKTYNLT